MNQHFESSQALASAIQINQEMRARAFGVVDAVDELQGQLGAFRAVVQLAHSDRHGNEGLPQLRRNDLAELITVLNTNLETHCIRARDAAIRLAGNAAPGSHPV